MRRLRQVPWQLIVIAIASTTARGALAADDQDFFEKRIRPILVAHCYECHSAKSEKLGGNLRVDTRSGLRAGGDNGPALVIGDPQKSLLLQAVRYDDDSLQMPPAGKLPQAALDDLERWIRAGAVDPRTDEVAPAAAAKQPDWNRTLAERRTWWSLQPVRKPELPPPDPTTDLHGFDRFLAAKLNRQGLEFAPLADRHTLIRRLSLVLTGLPPTIEEVEKFVAADGSFDSTYQDLVERLHDSPHFGERWARHWMDVVRFSETHGNEWNYEVHDAWRYRDYLIRAFNADVPFHQLVREHIAGDLLPNPRVNEAERFNESSIGTAFYRFGEVNHDDCIGLRQIGYDLADNQLDTLTKAFQATTVACARCHDHKIDAVSTRDYHALLGILRSSRAVSHTLDLPDVNAGPIERLRALKTKLRPMLAEHWRNDAAEIANTMRAAAALHRSRPDSESHVALSTNARIAAFQKALAAEKSAIDAPLELWRALIDSEKPGAPSAAERWKSLIEARRATIAERTLTETKFTTWADFRRPSDHGWEVRGLGLGDRPTSSGEFVVAPAGSNDSSAVGSAGAPLIASLLPAGYFTHALSDKLNGTLRSPSLPTAGKYISFEVVGRRSSAVRLVSNNCQLNYKNYRALKSDEPIWVTFAMPDERATLRTYAELMTMLDNPKFPDQLSALGGDKDNYRKPWDEAAGDKRSHFGITRAVVHDEPQPPASSLTHLTPLLVAEAPHSLDEVADIYAEAIRGAVQRWSDDAATDVDVRWLNESLAAGLLRNSAAELPAVSKVVEEYRAAEAELQSPRIAPGLGDFGAGIDQPIFVRGDWQRPGPIAPRGYLEVFDAAAFATIQGSGRLELARRIASSDNPLTARVIVNRVWQHLFGSGLVRTVDDFGRIGDLPSDPETLDYLTAEFIAGGWSIKRLVRTIACSRAFRSVAEPAAEALRIDPENRLLSHYPARRLEAEGIRDAILTASGRLDRTLYGPSVQPYRETANSDRRLFPGPLDGAGRRSIYIKFNLMESPKFLSAFNLPGGKVAQGRRDATQVPAQALALLNDPFVVEQAETWSKRLVRKTGDTLAGRIDAMFLTAYGRLPTTDERTQFRALIAELAKLHAASDDRVLASVPVWRDAAHALFTTEEFIYIP